MTAPAEVSVALCTCDGADHLGEQLDSIERQTHRAAEIVVGDDASLDDTRALLLARAELQPCMRLLDPPPSRLGLRSNLERVLAATTGEMIALSDQDDVWDPSRLARGVRGLEAEPDADLLASDGWFVDASGARARGSILRGLGVGPGRRRRLRTHPVSVVVRRAVANGNTILMRRRLLDAALPFPEVLDDPAHPVHPDRWLTWVAAGRGPVVIVDEPLVAYRRHEGQATQMERTRTGRTLAAARHESLDRGAAHGVRERLEARAAQLAEAARRTGSTELDAAAAHLARRARLVRGPRRLPAVVREIARGGYRWSGPGAAAADVWRGARA